LESSEKRYRQEDRIKGREVFLFKKLMKNNTDREAKRKESKSVLPEIQETFSKCKGNKEKSRELKNEAILLKPTLRRMKYKIIVLIVWMRIFVR
jgi:hypothetical protein